MDNETQIIAFPFPAQGHINPMFQFCKRLASRGIKVTLITYVGEEFITNNHAKHTSIKMESICSSSDENVAILTMEDYFKDFRSKLCRKMSEIVSNRRISCLVYDSVMPWALEVAKEFGVKGAVFFTQSCAVSSIYYQIHEGLMQIPDEEDHRECVTVEGMPLMGCRDLPTSVQYNSKNPYVLLLMSSQFSSVKEADWVFFNSFNALEQQVMKWMEVQWPLKLIGPAIPSSYVDEKGEDNKEHGLNLFQPKNNNSCLQWLDTKPASSVVYVAFGSLAALEKNQMEQVALALKMTIYNFLWVVRESEEHKLPPTFLEEITSSKKGIVVSWCSQPQVLSHKSIGCFITHCGWNSTLEALCLGVPMVAMPQWSDQLTNAKFIEDVWKIGVRVKADAEGIVSREEIEVCIKQVMEGDTANEIRMNCDEWKKFAEEAVKEGGSSYNNIEEFVAKLKCN